MIDFEIIKNFYTQFLKNIDVLRQRINRPLTLTEKILYVHSALPTDPVRGRDFCFFYPDRVAMQDATAQMALLQFINSGKNQSAVPASVHCDHLILAEKGASEDIMNALQENHEVFEFLESACNKFGIDFWPPGVGIIHQILLENYLFPGGMIIGTDSHTVNGGGLAMIAIGVGGADAVDVMAGEPWELKMPKIIGVRLTGKLSGWASAKDVVLKLAGILTAKGGTDKIIEYFGEGCATLSCTGKATICNMGAEVGATTSIFPYDKSMSEYLKITNRDQIADIADSLSQDLQADDEILHNPEDYFDDVIEIDLSELKPHINGPFTPDRAHEISAMKKIAVEEKYPKKVSAVLIGSCTNSSYEDFSAVAEILKDAQEKGLTLKTGLLITPGSESIRHICEKEGLFATIKEAGGTLLSNACGPCIGQWKRPAKSGKNSIITTFNRNFAGRNDGNPLTHAFITSPELATALALNGKISFDPDKDTMTNDLGIEIKLSPPQKKQLPASPFPVSVPKRQKDDCEIKIDKNSTRLQLLASFPEMSPGDFDALKLLVKIKGKCTTDHISMAGLWLKYRGHLENISENLLLGAHNYFIREKGLTLNPETGEYEPIAFVAKYYKKKNISSIIVAEENYGEGSSREHAAMEPRFLGVKVVLAKSFARIHETNLKKQGILAVTFANKDDYKKIKETDTFRVSNIELLTPDQPLFIQIGHKNGKKDFIELRHSYNPLQAEWFKAGSALNYIRKRARKQSNADVFKIKLLK
ncbi:MAG: aconitate hydratase [Candidatus Marinimicrobia bacterium]|nr:aconitate hydratase [Candidatus Neomarinimicrobiota bacterium]